MKSMAVMISMALAIGGIIGWVSAVDKNSARAVVHEKSRREDRATHAKWRKEDFLKDARERAQAIKQPEFNPLAEDLKDWSDEEIRAALDESLTDPECALSFGSGRGLASLLLREWMRRDFGSALDWFNQVEPRTAQARMAGTLSHDWPADRAKEGMDFAIKNRDLLGQTSPWSILGKNVEACAKEGPAAVEEFLQFARDNGFGFTFGNAIQFPEGFDFAALAKGESLKAMLEYDAGDSIIQAWKKQNPDEVFNWMLEERGAKSLTMLASDPDSGSLDAMKWMGGKFQTLQPEERAEFVEASLISWVRSPQGFLKFAEGADDPQAQDEIRRLGMQGIYGGQAHRTISLVEAIGDPAQRIEALKNFERSPVFEKRPDLRGFDSNNETFLRQKLAEWQADPATIETIISRFKP